MKILLIGSTGWIGRTFAHFADKSGIELEHIQRSEFWLGSELSYKSEKVDAVVNCAGVAGKPNVDRLQDKDMREAVIKGNISIPSRIALKSIAPILHVSSGCIYQGKRETGELREAEEFDGKHYKDSWKEDDKPNFIGSTYSWSKNLGEQALAGRDDAWIYRPRMFFTNYMHKKSFITKLLSYPVAVDAINSVTNLEEFCQSMCRCLLLKIPFGSYNITHKQPVLTSEILKELGHEAEYVSCSSFNNDMKEKGLAERSFTCLDNTKSQKAKVALSDNAMDIIKTYEAQ